MGEFFKGWRRKVGCATLLMACVLTAAWISSNDERHWFGGTSIIQTIEPPGIRPFYERDGIELFGTRIESHEGVFGPTRLVIRHDDKGFRAESQIYAPVPYWVVVISLTLLSVYLLLSKPRATTNDSSSRVE